MGGDIVLLHESYGFGVGVASRVRWAEARSGRKTGCLLEALGWRVDFLVLRTDLWEQERSMLSDG